MMRFDEEVAAALAEDRDERFAEVDDEALEQSVRVGAAEIAAATCRWLQALAEFVRRGRWSDQGARTPSEWLSWAVSMGSSTAREHVRVALRLRRFPAVEAEFAAGRLSYTKVRAITRCNQPELEDVLIRYCRYATGAQLEQIVRWFAHAQDGRRRVDAFESRSVDFRRRRDGRWEARVVLPLEQGLLVEQLVDHRAEAMRRDAGEGGWEQPLSAWRADALLSAVTQMSDEVPDDDGSDRYLVTVHVGADALEAPPVDGDRAVPARDERGRVLPAMSARTVRRLACTASLRLVAHDEEGQVCASSQRRRQPTPAQRRLLVERDRGCRFPGCQARRGLHAHHIVYFSDGGPTSLANLVLVCGFHHRFVHERGWRVAHDGKGRFAFNPPDEPVVPPALPPPDLRERLGLVPDPDRPGEFDPRVLEPDWDGTPPDHAACIDILEQELARATPPDPDEIAVAA